MNDCVTVNHHGPTQAQIEQAVTTALSRTLRLAPEQILPGSRLYEDLGLDSMALVNVYLYPFGAVGLESGPRDLKPIRPHAHELDVVVTLGVREDAVGVLRGSVDRRHFGTRHDTAAGIHHRAD